MRGKEPTDEKRGASRPDIRNVVNNANEIPFSGVNGCYVCYCSGIFDFDAKTYTCDICVLSIDIETMTYVPMTYGMFIEETRRTGFIQEFPETFDEFQQLDPDEIREMMNNLDNVNEHEEHEYNREEHELWNSSVPNWDLHYSIQF